ncbi:MAG: arsenical pump-driving ATPase GET3 [Nitrospirae bacterium]|nr:arsenical pump-driving ATPase GET3 [Nitrospirota bacterium]
MDTTPSGETLSLFSVPKYMRKHLRAGPRVFEGIDRIGKQLLGMRSVGEVLDAWIAASERIDRLIRNDARIFLVSVRDSFSVKRALALAKAYQGHHIELDGIVINRTVRSAATTPPDLRKVQAEHLRELNELGKGVPMVTLKQISRKTRSEDSLKETGEELVKGLKL